VIPRALQAAPRMQEDLVKHCLWKIERDMASAFAEVLLPLPIASPEMPILLDRIEDLLWHMTRDRRFLWRCCLWIFQLSGFFYYGKFRVMTRMDPAFRDSYVKAWHHTWWSVKRLIKRFLETIVFSNYYSMPETERRIGYTPEFHAPMSSRDFPSANLVRDFPASEQTVEADVCIIGSGAGGAFAAMSLAQAGRRVILIEEGDFFDASVFGRDTMEMTKRLYRGAGIVNTFGWPAILVPVGRCVGGTTVINSGTCFRVPDKVFDWWADRYGLKSWTAGKVEPYYRRVEELLEVAPAREEVRGRSDAVFARGAARLGMELKPLLRNAPRCSGSGTCCWGCPTNAKLSAQLSALPLAMQAGARVYARCRAERILYSRGRATEVLCRFVDPADRTKGPLVHVKAQAIIAACGTLHTPVLLGRSGIPDVSGARGKHLTLHPTSKIAALMEEEVCGWKGIPQGSYSDALIEEGIKIEGIFLPPMITSCIVLLTGKEHREVMERYRHLAIYGMMVSDTSQGRVVRGVGTHAVTIYNINRHDLAKYQRGITHLARAFFEAGATKVFPGIHTLPVVTREEGAAAIARLRLRNKDLDLQAFHPLGTCRMGADPRHAVTDANGRIYSMDNLFVADGSLFPTSLGVNPQMTIMAAALRVAEAVHREYL
jgi:choline dehydrogenase-like flavoprotein